MTYRSQLEVHNGQQKMSYRIKKETASPLVKTASFKFPVSCLTNDLQSITF